MVQREIAILCRSKKIQIQAARCLLYNLTESHVYKAWVLVILSCRMIMVRKFPVSWISLTQKVLNSNCFCRDESNTDYSNHLPAGLRGSMNTKTNPAREIVLSNAIVPGTKPFSEAHSLHGVPVKTSSNEKTKWNSSHGFNRPRIFCLQHALEVEELLHSEGGAHVLVICHSG